MRSNSLSIIRRKAFNYYNHMPYIMKILLSLSLRSIPPRLLLGAEFNKFFKMIKHTEYLSQEILNKMTEKNLYKILSQAYKTTGYYNNLFQKIGINEQDILKSPTHIISGIPFVDKSTIRANYSLFLSSTKKTTSCDYTSTGGTSGEPFYFHINSDRSAKEWAYFVDQWGRVGFNLKSKRVSFRGSPN